MLVKQCSIAKPGQLARKSAPLRAIEPQIVLVFAACKFFDDADFCAQLRDLFPRASLIGCSTAGEIATQGASSDSAVLTALHFDRVRVRVAAAHHRSMATSGDTGRALADRLAAPDLRGVLVFGPGVEINGSALVDGMAGILGPQVPLSGGLAGDNGAFKRTLTFLDGTVEADWAVAVGFYGDGVQLSHGCFGGWEPFGPVRKITLARGNVLYELDGQPALDLYKRYLGEHARDLPASGLLFPFEMLDSAKSKLGLIRTILGVDEAQRSLTLAGDLDPSGYLRLMQASTDALVDGAERAAATAREALSSGDPGLVLLVSCVGRKLVMGLRVDEEVEAVADVYGIDATIAGFYSYGEISPLVGATECRLHNQTMTVTLLRESAG